ncbi:helix-turn-helix domain-containing protein [Pedobacter gandavensis]|uniref:helix-turn-helix domain-containing protein n=1 Tax=Pedobacter gandavensis TaxID=2679963 RepID=UPI00247A89E9|nr:helix-turn-helix domain-containing protein [Pedobacter gandavensis]WGQ09859.1 helix-turn-helix domain-containing protein [Pedobacter gandavensis]
MKIDIITTEDLQQFKMDIMQEIKGVLHHRNLSQNKEWLRSSEVKTMLKISGGTLQNLRINSTIPFRKIGGTMYYDKSVIDKMLEG